MPVLISPQTNHNRPIIISRPEEKLDPDALGDQLADLARRRRITTRDEMLLEHLLAVGVLTLDQIRRLLWPEAAPKTAADRLSKLWQWHLIRRARPPWSEFPTPNLNPGPIFGLGQGGWWWLAEPEPENYAYRLIEAEWVWQQLPVTEIYTRLAATGASFDWQPRWRELPEPFRQADPTAVITLRRTEGQPFTLPLELGLIDSFQAKTRIKAYDELRWRETPLVVLLVVRNDREAAQAVADIRQHRQQPIPWLVSSWEQLAAAPELLHASIWQWLDWQAPPRRVSLVEVLDD